MKNLINVTNQNGNLVVSSREVAVNFEKEHKHVLDAIDNLIRGLAEKSTTLFYETTYIHPQNKQEYREVLMNRDGFTLLAMGFTGQRALEWKLKYIEAFNKMEQELKLPRQLTAMEQLKLQYEVLDNHDERLTNLENNMTIDYGQQQELQNLAKYKALKIVGGKESPAYQANGLRTKVFSSIWKDYKDYFQINSYRNTPRKDLDKAIEYIQNWQPQGKLLREIEETNRQIAI